MVEKYLVSAFAAVVTAVVMAAVSFWVLKRKKYLQIKNMSAGGLPEQSFIWRRRSCLNIMDIRCGKKYVMMSFYVLCRYCR